LIDRLRKEIQERLDQLASEAEKLRGALVALDQRGASSKPAARPPARPRPTRARAHRTQPTDARRPKAPKATKPLVLSALAVDKAMTAGEVAAATGLPRPAVSTMLSRLAKSGEVSKAERGYRLP
jgi:CRP-like cAMP-binding protein